MTNRPDIVFAPLAADPEPTCVVLAGEDVALGARARELDQRAGGAIAKAAEAAQFKGKKKSTAEMLAPPRIGISRLLLLGLGKAGDLKENDWVTLGGATVGAISARKTKSASLIAEAPEQGGLRADTMAALLAFGAALRLYEFRKYLTKQKPDEDNALEPDKLQKLVVHCADPDKARQAFARYQAVANGVVLARDLVNEPANVLGPVEFAERAKKLEEEAGVEVEILDADELAKLKMGALLAVAQGSVRPARVAVMQWHGAKSKRSKPIAFIGKGVVFDTGGISIKPAAGMEDMKGDMGGAACVIGLMHALAERKANVNAIGIIGLVENMPSGTATRPGDIVTAHSGQTVEILNTDAEGRLVLADLISYAQERFKPRLIIDLATLTGAIMVALGKEYAGLFSNDEKLANELIEASNVTGEKIWRMPLDKAYDKMLESKNADIKNIGGRWAGACTAAAFIKYFVKDTPWAHIDLAGTAMDAPKSEINPSWGSGWGVRLLDRFVADKYEK
ncbi:MAG TPA: leucyl aminopeptidase [Hyphomicrobium sp.]|jgi:leucyl aminopeptidase